MGFKTKHLQREEVKMADNVSFKVYLKDPSQGEELEVRRFVVDKEVSTSLVYIKEKLVSIFPVLADKIFSVSWTDEHGLLQRRRLARQPARGQGRGHRQGARHPPAGQEVDNGTSLESLSAASLWSCLLETNPYIFWSQLWEGTNPILSLT